MRTLTACRCCGTRSGHWRARRQCRRHSGPKPTFTKDIAPIFREKCEACHRPDSIAPMSLVTFKLVQARSIKSA
jgi:hypothetical protein